MSAKPNQEPGLIERHGLTRDQVAGAVWTIEPSGRRRSGAAAAGLALREMGGAWRALGHLARVPGAGLVYAVVARTRGRLSAHWGDPPPYPEG